MFCHKCGAQIAEGAAFCQKCGTKLIVDAPTEQSAAVPSVSPTQQPNPTPANTSKKKSKLPIIIGVIAAVVILAIVFVVFNWEGKTDYVATVWAYEPFANSQGLPYTCGEVFDKYIPDSTWNVRKSGNAHCVDISGTAQGLNQKIVITMEVSEDSKDPNIASITPVAVTVDGKELDGQNTVDIFFLSLFVAYDEKMDDLSDFGNVLLSVENSLSENTDPPETPSDAPAVTEQLLFRGTPVENIMGAHSTDIISIFGEPEMSDRTALEYGAMGNNDMIFNLDSMGQVKEFIGQPSDFTFDGKSLSQDFDTLATILGNDYTNMGGTAYSWQVFWNYRDYQIYFSFPMDSDDNKSFSVDVMKSDLGNSADDDDYSGDDNTYYPNLDSSLVGRWRAYDGGYVEFDEYGNADVSFRPHASILSPDYITWQVSNGQIVLSSHYSEASRWKLTERGSMQYLTISRTTYTRSESDTSLVGTWDEIGDRYRTADALILFSDGTGTISKVVSSATWERETVPISWWTDDTNFYSEWTILSGYDYTVSGDMLTLYFSNGSQVYTKVGN